MTADRPISRKPRIVAFTSPANDPWRTEVVSNTAWVLAAAGHRVAIADWDRGAPRVHDHLQPFHVNSTSVEDLLDEMLDDTRFSTPTRHLLFDEQTRPRLDARRYELPGGLGRIDVLAASDTASQPRGFGPEDGTPGEVEMLRAGVQRSVYDIVLIDSPASLTPEFATRMARLCDVVAVCFDPETSTRQAAWFAGEVWNSAPVSIRVLAVPVHFDEAENDKAKPALTAITSAFHPLLTQTADEFGRDMSADIAGIPSPDTGPHTETLVVLTSDDPAQLEAYQRLASALGGVGISAMRMLSIDQLESYRRSVGLLPTLVALEWSPEDRPWADWVRSLLVDAGAEVVDGAEHPGATVVRVCSRHSPPPPAPNGRRIIAVTVDDAPLPDEPAPANRVSLADTSEAGSQAAVLEALSFVPGPVATGVRFPRTVSRNERNLPRRLALFAGRGDELEAMRDALGEAEVPVTWWLTGTEGVGKTELVKEYAHRFDFDYEHVWWIPANDRMTITASLAELARVLGVPAENQVKQRVLDLLGKADRTKRWLLVYDGAEDPGVLEGLVPTRGCGHVVITSRTRPRDQDVVELGPFSSRDSVTYLGDLLKDVSRTELAEVAERAAHEPLALRLARAWIVLTSKKMRQEADLRENAEIRAAQEFCALSDADGGGAAIPRTIRMVVNTLEQDELGRSVLRVARACSMLSPDGVALSLLHKVSMLTAVSGTVDDIEFDGMLWHGVRHGMFHVSWRRPATVTVHRLLLSQIAELSDEDDLSSLRAAVQEGLAAVAPAETELDNACGGELRELGKHIMPSGAPSSDSPAVRRWLVCQMGYFLRAGDHEAWTFAARLCERLLQTWLGDEASGLRMRLRFHLGNLYRCLDNPIEALKIDERLLLDQRRVLGREHPRTLLTARGVAHGMRVLGNFSDALIEEQATVRGLRRVLGEDHPDTLRANNNLAQSLFLAGEPGAALKVQRANRKRRQEVLGPNHLDVWWSTCSIAVYLRELGRYDQAWSELQSAKQRVAQLPGSPRNMLRIKWNQAIILRRRGDHHNAKAATVESLTEYRQTFGEDHPDTRACKLSFAADHFAVGEFDVAVEQARDCLSGYQSVHGVYHAFTLMCQLDHAIFLHWLGRAPEEALRSVRDARDGLITRLGDVHPWALAGRLAHAVVLGRTSDADLGFRLLEETHEDCVEFLGAAHPTTKTVAANLTTSANEWLCVVLDVPEM